MNYKTQGEEIIRRIHKASAGLEACKKEKMHLFTYAEMQQRNELTEKNFEARKDLGKWVSAASYGQN